MPKTKVVFYKEDDGSVPILEWLDSLPERAVDKCTVRIERLRELGHELRRPEADLIRNGIHELRVRLQHVNYRILYFFHGNVAAIISDGLMKEEKVPRTEIDLAIQRKKRFEGDPERHTHVED